MDHAGGPDVASDAIEVVVVPGHEDGCRNFNFSSVFLDSARPDHIIFLNGPKRMMGHPRRVEIGHRLEPFLTPPGIDEIGDVSETLAGSHWLGWWSDNRVVGVKEGRVLSP